MTGCAVRDPYKLNSYDNMLIKTTDLSYLNEESPCIEMIDDVAEVTKCVDMDGRKYDFIKPNEWILIFYDTKFIVKDRFYVPLASIKDCSYYANEFRKILYDPAEVIFVCEPKE